MKFSSVTQWICISQAWGERSLFWFFFPENLLPIRLQMGKGMFSYKCDCSWHVFHQLRWVWYKLCGSPVVHSRGFWRWQNPVLTWIFCQCHSFLRLLPYFLGEGSGSGLLQPTPKGTCQKSVYDCMWCVVLSCLLSRHQPSLLVHWKWD